MPTTYTYPGVYVEEIPSGVRTITGVATSITAFVGRARRGPTDEPRTINNYGDFERIYGGLWEGSTVSFAVRDFYRNGGTRAIIARLYHPTFETNGEDETERDEVFAAVQTPTRAVAEAVADAAEEARENGATAGSVADATTTAAREVAGAAADAARDVADAAGQAEVDGAEPEAVAEAATNASEIGDEDSPERVAAKAVADAAGKAAGEVGATASNVAKATETAAARVIRATDTAARAIAAVARRAAREDDADAASVADAATRDETVADAAARGANEAVPRARARLSVDALGLEARDEGAWGNEIRVRVNHVTRDLEEGESRDSLFNLAILDGETGQIEEIRNVSITDGHPRQVNKVLTSESQLVRMTGDLPPNGPAPHPTPAGVDVWAANTPATNAGVATADRASDGERVEVADFTGTGKAATKQGLYQLEKVDLLNILCIPPYKDDRNVDQSLITDATKYCEERRAFLLVDPPTAWIDKEGARKGINGEDPEGKIETRSKNAAVFFPRFVQPNPLRDNQEQEFVPCGAVAGVFARTDAQRGVWKAPAGLAATLAGVPKLSVRLTDPEIGELNPLGVNCLRVAPAAGPVAWGARTLDGDDRLASEWKYIPVRRLALFIEESLYRGTQWVVFEPNDEPLWAQIRLNVGAFMRNLFRQGAFQGASPREAYFVKCDKESTTQNDINLGIVNIVVGFAPLKPAEFVILKIQQIAGEILT
jgi:phage tail sheath protein FI